LWAVNGEEIGHKMAFKITIQQTLDEQRHIGKEWRLVEKDRYDYTPETDTVATVTRILYEQTVSDLDLWAVVSAVNGKD
jgi:hypothetical protein